MSSTQIRYDQNNEKYKNSSSRGVVGGDRFHYTSPQGKAIRKDQNFDHVMKAKREHRQQMEPIHQLSLQRGGGKAPKKPPKRPIAKIRRKTGTPPIKRKQNFCKSKTLRNAPPTTITPKSVYVSFLFLLKNIT